MMSGKRFRQHTARNLWTRVLVLDIVVREPEVLAL